MVNTSNGKKKKFLIYLLGRALPKYENYNTEFLLVPNLNMPSYGLHSMSKRNVTDCLYMLAKP